MQLRPFWILLGGSIVVCGLVAASVAHDHFEDGQVIEEQFSPEQAAPAHEIYRGTTPPCCAPPTLANTHYLIVSTMDGKIKALDVARGGATVWEANFDAQPLMEGSLGRVQPMEADGREFHLVPALDGSLYMYSLKERILEPIPLNTEALLLASVKIGHEAVAGGKTITTTGIDPITGKVRYHCSMAQCDSAADGDVQATLVFKRSAHAVRAMDALTGSERWNLSVAEYEANLLIKNRADVYPGSRHSARFLVRPPEGIVTALDSCGSEMWSSHIGNHIAHVWELAGADLREVSLFESRNIHSLSVEEEFAQVNRQQFIESESLFYLGTCNSMPFIIHSPKMKSASARLSRDVDAVDGRKERQLVPAVRNTYFLEPRTLVDMITSSYKNSFTNQLEDNSNKQVALSGPRDVQVVNRDERPTLTSCPNADGVALIGQMDIRSARFSGQHGWDYENGDDGFFVLRYTSPRKRWYSPRDHFGQCGIVHRLRRSLRVEDTVSGWWRAFALGMIGLVGFVSVFVVRWFRTPPAMALPMEVAMVEEVAQEAKENEYILPESSSGSQPLAKKKLSPSYSSEPPTPPAPIVPRISNHSGSEGAPFESKFMQDFEVLRVLGKGGYGVVFAARNKIDDNVYAVKRVAVAKSDKAIQRVLREVRAMALLDHPGVIRYFHSWMERPPPHWQEETDKELLKTLRARRLAEKERHGLEDGEESNALESMSLPLAVGASRKCSEVANDCPADPGPSEHSECHSLEMKLNRDFDLDHVEEDPADPGSDSSGSWLDESAGSEDDSSSATDADSEDSDEEPNIKAPLKEESESIVFMVSSRSRHQSVKSTSSQDVSVIEPSLVLAAQNEDLLPCKDTKCHAYVYMQMQLCQSRTLSDWLKRHQLPEDREVKRMRFWFAQLVAATGYIHDQGLIHRDIKPQNIFFAADDHLKIGDMGLVSKNIPLEDDLSAESSPDILHTGNVGTKSYMSPEQLAHRPYTFKVDVFSLGVVFVEMLLPFATIMERLSTLAQLQRGQVPAAFDNRPDEKEFVAWLCAMDPTARPTCEEILDSAYLREATPQMFARERSVPRRISLCVAEL